MQVMVVHLRPGFAFERRVRLRAGATVEDALAASGVLAAAGLNAAELDVGVFGRACTLADRLRDNDRVEIYRPLSVDPMQARRIRADVRRRRRQLKVVDAAGR